MMNISLLVLVVAALGGCGLVLGVAVLVVWAILDNARRKSPPEQDQ